MSTYYNESDPKAAAWLRELIKGGNIPAGFVDERSIEDVQPSDLTGYRQHHFFAGIGGWALALQWAGWPEDKPVWTGSCPCQPFSAAGRHGGVDDPRHLWPAWRWLIDQCRPSIVFGEQVASKAGRAWFSGVSHDLEAMGYSAAAADLCAASIGAPHIRQRLWFVGSRMADGDEPRLEGRRGVSERPDQCPLGQNGVAGGLADTSPARRRGDSRPGTHHGGWANADWLGCRDGKFRPVEPGTFPLAHGLPVRMGRCGDPGAPQHPGGARVMRLRGYGNAIVPQTGAEFIRSFMETRYAYE